MKTVLWISSCILAVCLLVMPAALGYWYIWNGVKAFSIPIFYWIIPSVILFIHSIMSHIFLKSRD